MYYFDLYSVRGLDCSPQFGRPRGFVCWMPRADPNTSDVWVWRKERWDEASLVGGMCRKSISLKQQLLSVLISCFNLEYSSLADLQSRILFVLRGSVG